MNEGYISVIVFAAIIGLVFGYWRSVKYFQQIENKTGYKPLNKTNTILMGASLILPSIYSIIVKEQKPSVIDMILYLIPFIILVKFNLRIIDRKHIIIVSVLQVVFGVAYVFVAVCIVVIGAFLMISDGQVFPNKSIMGSYDDWAARIKESWLGHELDYERANKMGFNSPEDAMEAGYLYDGNQIFKYSVKTK